MRMNEIKSSDNLVVSKVLTEVEDTFGMIPKLWSLYANNPALMQVNWMKQKLVMSSGLLRRELKEAIALSVSLENSCAYCVDAHTMMLTSLGVNVAQVKKSAYIEAGFSDKEKNLLELAKAVNKDAYKIQDALLESVRASGNSDEEILEVIGVVELFVGYNMFLNTLDVAGGSL